MSDIESKLAELKIVGIIKDYKEIIKPNGSKSYDIDFFDPTTAGMINTLKKVDDYIEFRKTEKKCKRFFKEIN